jgi:hypothetical protein
MGLKLKKGDKLVLLGFERNPEKHLIKIMFETVGGNKLIVTAEEDANEALYIDMHVIDEKKLEEELDVT